MIWIVIFLFFFVLFFVIFVRFFVIIRFGLVDLFFFKLKLEVVINFDLLIYELKK